MDNNFIELVIVVLLGMVSQLAAWFTRLPSILLLIFAGFIAGPLLGVLHPDRLLGNLFEPIVGLSVAVILFEGGLNLKFKEIKTVVPVVLRLLSIGVLVTWGVTAAAAVLLLRFEIPMAVLLGAILVVSGPTVIMPLIRHIRPRPAVSAVLKWEGILVDPIGAILALAVLEVILQSSGTAVLQIAPILAWSLVAGVSLGWLGGFLIAQALRQHLLPDYLHIPATLGALAAIYLCAEVVQPNAGLVAAIAMGVVLANQQYANISHILEFKENLRLLLLSFLFILLSARFDVELFRPLTFSLVVFVLILLFIRPVVVFISAIKSELNSRDKWLLSSIAPRGIVAASVASLFAFRLTEGEYPGGELLTPVTFAVIFGTVLVSSVISPLAARALKLGQLNPQGILIFGGQLWVRDVAALLNAENVKCLIIDINQANVAYARRRGLEAVHADALEGTFLDDNDFSAYGYAASVTADSNFNMLVNLRLSKLLGSSNVFTLASADPSSGGVKNRPPHMPGRLLFDGKVTYDRISELNETGKFKIECLNQDVDSMRLNELIGKDSLLCFALSPGGNLTVITPATNPCFKAGTKIIFLKQMICP